LQEKLHHPNIFVCSPFFRVGTKFSRVNFLRFVFFFWSHLAKNIFLDKFWFSKKVMVLKFFLGGFDFSGSIDQDWERGVGRNFTNIFFVQITDNISKKRILCATTIYTKTITTNINKRGIN